MGLDCERTNVNGEAIALGHPLAASGSRITAYLVHEMRQRNVCYSIGSVCIGGGQGILCAAGENGLRCRLSNSILCQHKLTCEVCM